MEGARRPSVRASTRRIRAGGAGWDFVFKVGGSLGQSRSLPRLLQRIGRLARSRRVLVVPGGGRFADLVRTERARLRLDEDVAHRMALRAMDQYGLLLASLVPRAAATAGLREARRAASRGRVPVLLASGMVERERRIERTFRLTSDSIAALVARRTGAARLVLLKRCAGPAGPAENRGEIERLARRGVVDPLFPVMAPRGAEIWIIDGRSARAWRRLVRGVAADSRRGSVRRRGARRGTP